MFRPYIGYSVLKVKEHKPLSELKRALKRTELHLMVKATAHKTSVGRNFGDAKYRFCVRFAKRFWRQWRRHSANWD